MSGSKLLLEAWNMISKLLAELRGSDRLNCQNLKR